MHKGQESYYGFVRVNNLDIFVSETQYHQLCHSLNLKDCGLYSYRSGNPDRMKNYKIIKKYYENMKRENPDDFDFHAFHFWYCNDDAREVLSDFLNKYALRHKNWHIEFEHNSDLLEYPFGMYFTFVREQSLFCSPLALEFDVNKVIRLRGTTSEWDVVFDCGISYSFDRGAVTIGKPKFSSLISEDEIAHG